VPEQSSDQTQIAPAPGADFAKKDVEKNQYHP